MANSRRRRQYSSSSSPRRRGMNRRTSAGAPRWAVWLMALLVICMLGMWALAFCSEPDDAQRHAAPATEADSLQVVRIPADIPQQIIHYDGMTVNFNPETHQPNYVAWELLPSETDGESGRESTFIPDPEVPASALSDDYRNSGYDRGHMAPAGDMKWSPRAMRQSFYTTNICPQAGELNRGSWKKLEEKCRQKAVDDSALIIICGPIFDRGIQPARIGPTGVAVPQRFFKVILSLHRDPPMAIGFVMPNGQVPGGMQSAAMTIDQVEAITGYDFFSALPDPQEAQLESYTSFPKWSARKRR